MGGGDYKLIKILAIMKKQRLIIKWDTINYLSVLMKQTVITKWGTINNLTDSRNTGKNLGHFHTRSLA